MSNLTDISMISKLIPVLKELATNKDLINALVTLSKIPCSIDGVKFEATDSGCKFECGRITKGVKEVKEDE